MFIQISYFAAAILFIYGLKQMSSPVTARRGIIIAGWGMLIAVLVTFGAPNLHNYILMILAITIGTTVAWISAKRVAMTDMPQMVALYNGMGGGSAAAIAAVALIQGHSSDVITQTLAVLGALIGTVAFSGSLIAYAKLQGIIKKNPHTAWTTYNQFVAFYSHSCHRHLPLFHIQRIAWLYFLIFCTCISVRHFRRHTHWGCRYARGNFFI